MKIKNNDIKITDIGLLPISIPIRSIGSGTTKIAIVAGIHGEESSSLLIIDRILQTINTKNIGVEINFILAANLLSQVLRTRENPVDKLDLNRVFPGNDNGEVTKKIASNLLRFCLTMNLVIDLHTFEGQCPIVGIDMNSGNKNIKQKSLELIKLINLDCIWQLNFTKDEAKMSGALGPILAEKNIPNFAIEMPEHQIITENQINHISNGIIKVIKKIKSNKKTITPIAIPVINKINIRSQESGIFKSKLSVMKKVKKDETIGDLISLNTFEKTKIKSPCDGLLIVNKNNHLVFTGEILASIGTQAH